MGTRLFVGNLSYNVSEQELKEVFQSEQIEVRSVRVAMDRDTGRPRGFAFVETATEDGAKQSIEKLGGRLIQGRPIIIEEAQAKPAAGGPRPGGGLRPGGGPGGGPGGPPRSFGPRPMGPGGPRPGGPGPSGPGGPPRTFGPPRPGAVGADSRGPDRLPKAERRDRPEKKRSTRPKPEERERGNWHWSGILDDD
jgi:RNA recognition motif-containing protein